MPEISDKLKWAVALGVGGMLVAVAIVGALANRGEAVAARPVARLKQSEPRMTQEEMRARLATAQTQQPVDPREDMKRAIQSHQEAVQQRPDDPEAPALYLAMGNLHRRLFNYEEAIWAYQQIFVRYPDWDGLPMVYGELASCYEESGDHDNMLRIYMEMMRVFPEDSREHRFACGKLGL